MFKSLFAVVLASSLLLGGCVTTTTTCTLGDICWESQTSSTPAPSSQREDEDHTGAIVAVSALVTAIALFAVLHHRDDEARPTAEARGGAARPVVAYIVPPATGAAGGDDIRLQRMYVQGHLSARAGRCDATIAIDKQLAATSASYHERYAADPTIAQCLQTNH